MLLKDYCEELVKEYTEKGYKQVKVGRITACKLHDGMVSIELFNPGTVSPDKEIVEHSEMVREKKYQGADIKIEFIKPRCRKVSTDYKHVALAD